MSQTFKYKNQYIHYGDENNEVWTIQFFDYSPENYGNFEIYQVKSFRAAQLLITKLLKEQTR